MIDRAGGCGPPIFILGMLQRTGTNHLSDVFELHPDVEALQPVFEDHLVRFTPHLFAYVEDVTRFWSEEWEVPDHEGSDLLRSLGDGVLRWVAGHAEARVVAKMPSVEQAHRFFEIFPECPLVVLVRDGRNVAESGVQSFGWTYEWAFWRWSRAADIVLQLREQHGDDPRFAIVRYEDLVERPAEVMKALCTTTGLAIDRYPFEAMEQLPVRGSSTLRTDAGSDIHWEPVARTASFDPSARWRDWDDHLHRRFAKVAGRQQRALGYDLVEVGGTDSVGDRLSSWWDRTSEVQYLQVRRTVGAVVRNVRRIPRRI